MVDLPGRRVLPRHPQASADGEYRVQAAFGGTARRAKPPAAVLHVAERALSVVGPETLYARADLVEVGGQPVVMELELVEPSLFFGLAPESGRQLAEALAVWLPGRAAAPRAGPR